MRGAIKLLRSCSNLNRFEIIIQLVQSFIYPGKDYTGVVLIDGIGKTTPAHLPGSFFNGDDSIVIVPIVLLVGSGDIETTILILQPGIIGIANSL